MATALHCRYKFLKKPYTLAGFEPVIFCSVGVRNDNYATPPGLNCNFLQSDVFVKNCPNVTQRIVYRN
jgi:hypothetical protein